MAKQGKALYHQSATGEVNIGQEGALLGRVIQGGAGEVRMMLDRTK